MPGFLFAVIVTEITPCKTPRSQRDCSQFRVGFTPKLSQTVPDLGQYKKLNSASKVFSCCPNCPTVPRVFRARRLVGSKLSKISSFLCKSWHTILPCQHRCNNILVMRLGWRATPCCEVSNKDRCLAAEFTSFEPLTTEPKTVASDNAKQFFRAVVAQQLMLLTSRCQEEIFRSDNGLFATAP